MKVLKVFRAKFCRARLEGAARPTRDSAAGTSRGLPELSAGFIRIRVPPLFFLNRRLVLRDLEGICIAKVHSELRRREASTAWFPYGCACLMQSNDCILTVINHAPTVLMSVYLQSSGTTASVRAREGAGRTARGAEAPSSYFGRFSSKHTSWRLGA